MKFFRTILLILLILLPLSIYGKQLDYKASLANPVDITALILEYNKEENVYIAKGKVEVREGARFLSADSVVYNENTKEIFAEGNVVFQDGDDVVQCEKIHLNLFTKKGSIEKGKIFIKKGGFYIAGDHIEKVGEATYTIKKGELTTCGWEKPAWKFSARDVEITVEGYAKTKGARFYILDQTVFYLPWGMFPVKTERQSGFLLPEFTLSSRDGTVFKNSYFWAISRDKDATFYLDYIEKRGVKFGSEFRYALQENSKGTWYYSIIDDNKYHHGRYELKGQHEQVFKEDLVLKLNINHVSDNKYIEDFGQTTIERSETLLKSTIFFEKPFKSSLLTYELSYFNNLLLKDNDPTFKYYPHASFFTEYIPIMKEKLFTDISADFINFYRETGDRYSRFSLEPKLRLPLSWNGINLLFNGTMYETMYLVDYADRDAKQTERRETFKVDGDMNVQLMRNYHTEAFGIGDMQSLIKPQLKYTFIPNSAYRDIPSIDPYDRIYKTNTVTYSLNHYLNTFSTGWARELSLLEIEQTYGLSGNLNPSDLYRGYGNRFSDISAKVTMFPKEKLSIGHESVINTYGNGWNAIKNSLNYTESNVYHVNLQHNYAKYLNNELYFDLGGTYKYIDGKYQIRYSLKDKMWIDTLYQITYHPKCWAVTLTLTQTKRPRDTSVKCSFDLAGLTSR